MAKVGFHPIVECFTGNMGKLVFRRSHNGKVSVYEAPYMKGIKWSQGQGRAIVAEARALPGHVTRFVMQQYVRQFIPSPAALLAERRDGEVPARSRSGHCTGT